MSDQLLEKIPPQSMESEQATLGAMLLEKDAIEKAVELLREEDFYREAHRMIFRGVLDIYTSGDPVDLITLGEWLKVHEQLEAIGGTMYLTTIMSQVPTAAGIVHYAKIVRTKAMQRALIRAADQIMTDAYQGDQDVDALARDAEATIMSIGDRASADRYAGLKRIGQAVADAAQRRKEADAAGHDRGYRPSLRPLRHKLVPMVPGTYCVIGGEPSLGKTVLGYQIVLEMVDQGAKGLFVSAEMDEDSLCTRMVKAYTALDLRQAESVAYRLDHASEVYGAWEKTATILNPFDMMLIDLAEVTPLDILTIGRRARRELGGLDVVLVDYIQLLSPDGKTDGDTAAMTAISKGLKRVAKQLKVALIAISSLNQASEQYEGRAPTLRRFRQSGQIKFDADVAMLLHRPDREDKSRVECLIEKQRNGPTGKVELAFSTEHLWFGDPEQPATEERETARQSWGYRS